MLAVAGIVVAARRTEAPWARAFKWYLLLGVVVIAIRVAFRIVLGGDLGPGEHVLFTLPQIPLPGFMSGVQLGGPVSAESVLAAVYDGLRLATLLCCIGAANTLANPKRALRVLPGRALRARRHDHRRGHRRAAARRERAARAPGAQAARRHRAGPAGGARHRDAGAARRARPLVPARGRDGLARLRPHRRRRPRACAASPPRCCSPGCSGSASAPTACSTRRHRGSSARPTLALGVALAAAGLVARRPARPAHALPARPVGVRGMVHRALGRGRRDRDASWPAATTRRRSTRRSSRSRGRRCPLLADRSAILCALLPAALTPPPPVAAPRSPSAAPARPRPRRRAGRERTRDPLRARHDHVPRRRRADAARRRPRRSPRASCAWSSARPEAGSRRCSARSTGWSRTSPAASCAAASPSTGATRARIRHASWPTSSAS